MRNRLLLFAAPALILLLGLASLAPPVQAQAVKDLVVNVAYVSVKPDQAEGWLVMFKKNFEPALNELQQQGALLGWHLFVPGIHHPGAAWTHALVLGSKDRAAQATVEKKLREVVAAMAPGDAQKFYGALDFAKHFDDEWRDIDLEAIKLPEEKKEEKKEESKP